MTTSFRRSLVAVHSGAPRWRQARFLLAVGWVALAALGGLNQRLLPRAFDSANPLVWLMPHLRYGYVMFADMRTRFVVGTFRETPEATPRPLSDLLPNDSWGYAESRAFLMLNTAPGFIEWVCANAPVRAEPLAMNVRYHRFESPGTARIQSTRERNFLCNEGRLHERRPNDR